MHEQREQPVGQACLDGPILADQAVEADDVLIEIADEGVANASLDPRVFRSEKPFPARVRRRYSASRRAEVVSDAYRDSRGCAAARPRLVRVDTRARRPDASG